MRLKIKNWIKNNFKYLKGSLSELQKNWPEIKILFLLLIKFFFTEVKVKSKLFWITFKEAALLAKQHSLPTAIVLFKKGLVFLKKGLVFLKKKLNEQNSKLDFHRDLINKGIFIAHYKEALYNWYLNAPRTSLEFWDRYGGRITTIAYWGDLLDRFFDVLEWLWKNLFWLHYLNFLERDLYYIMDYAKEEWVNYKRRRAARWRIRWRFFRKKKLLPFIYQYRLNIYWRYFLFTTGVFFAYFMYRFKWLNRLFEFLIYYYKQIFALPRQVFNEIIAENSAFLKEEYIDEDRWAVWPAMWALWCVSLWGYVIWYKHNFYMISPIPIRAFEMMTAMLFDSRIWFIDANKGWWTAFVLGTDSEYSYNTPAFNPELKYRAAEFYHSLMRAYPAKMFDVLENIHHGNNCYRWGSFFYYPFNSSLLSFRFVNNFVETIVPNFHKKMRNRQSTYLYLEYLDTRNFGYSPNQYYLPYMTEQEKKDYVTSYTMWDYYSRQGAHYLVSPWFRKDNFFEYDEWARSSLINKNSIMGLYTPLEAVNAFVSVGQFGAFLAGSQNIMNPVLANYRMRTNRTWIYYNHMHMHGWRIMLNINYRSLDYQHYLGITEDNSFFLKWSFKKKQHRMFVNIGHFYKTLFLGETDRTYYAIRNRIQMFYRYRPFYYFPTLAFYYHGEVLFMGCVSAPFIYVGFTNIRTAFVWRKIGVKYYNRFKESGIKELDNLILLDLYSRSYRRAHSLVVILLTLWLILDYYSNVRTFNFAHGWLLGHINEFKELNAQLGGITDYSDGERLLNLAMTPEFFNLTEVASYFGRNPRLVEDLYLYEGTTRRREDAFLFEYFMPDWYVIKKVCACNEISDIEFFSPFWKKKIIGKFNLTGYTLKHPELPVFNVFFSTPIFPEACEDMLGYIWKLYWLNRAVVYSSETLYTAAREFFYFDLKDVYMTVSSWIREPQPVYANIDLIETLRLTEGTFFLKRLRAATNMINFIHDQYLANYVWRSCYLPRWTPSGALRMDLYKEFLNIKKDAHCVASKWYNIVGLLKQATMEFYPHLLFDFDSHYSDYQKWVTPKYLVGEGEYYIFNYVKKRNRYLKFYKNMTHRVAGTILYLETFARLEYFDLENIHSFKIEHEAARHHFFKKRISQRPPVWRYGRWDKRALSFDWAMSKYCDKYYRSGLYHNINRVMMFSICVQNKRVDQWENREIVAPPNCLHEEALWYRFNVLPYFHGIGKRNLDYTRLNCIDYDDCKWYEEAGRGNIGQFFQVTKNFKLYTFYPKQHIVEGNSYIKYPLFNWMWELYTLSFLRQTLDEESEVLEDRIIPKLDNFCFRAWDLRSFNHYIGRFGKILPDIGLQCSAGNIMDFRFCQISEVVPSLSKIHISMMDVERFNEYYSSLSWYQIFYSTKTNGFYWFFLLYKFAVVMIIFMVIFTIINRVFLYAIKAHNFNKRSSLRPFGTWLYKTKISEIFANRLTYYMFYWFWIFIFFLSICFYQELVNYYYWDKTKFWVLMKEVYYESMHPAWLVREFNNLKYLWYTIFTRK